MKSCALCRNKFEADEPAVLFISKYGSVRVLCPQCEQLLDEASAEVGANGSHKAKDAVLALADHVHDHETLSVLRGILDGEISSEETEADEAVAAMWEETRADPAEDEEDESKEEVSGIKGYVPLIVAGAVFVGFLLWWFFLR